MRIHRHVQVWLFAFLICVTVFPVRALAGNQRSPSVTHLIPLLQSFRPIGGTGNNLDNPGFNATPGSPEQHLAPLNFAPGTADGLIRGPNPRTISNLISGGTGAQGQDGQSADSVASAWLYVWGQFVDHDLSLEFTPTTTDAINITIPPNDPDVTPGTVIAMNRAVRSRATNTIINTSAGYLDLSQLYGSTNEIADSLRNADGTMKSSPDGHWLPIVGGVFESGDPRVMENPELTAVTTLFMREHNSWVGQLKTQHPAWSGDQLYEMARAITTAEYENIVYSEYLPVLIGPVVGPYNGYDSSQNAQVSQEFSAAAFRVGHSQISDTQEGVDNAGVTTFSEALSDAFFNSPQADMANGVDPLLRSFSLDFAQATDVYVVATLRNLLAASLVGGGVDLIDLIAIDIQRERDLGVGTLNQVRRALGFAPYQSFAALTSDSALQARLKTVYGNIDQVDLFIGGLAEPHATGAVVGPTFQRIIGKQFSALRAGDRYFWLNQGFDSATSNMIQNTTLADIILRNSDTQALQQHVFIQGSPPVASAPHHRRNAIVPRGMRPDAASAVNPAR
ncbi:peroxidase family protein [Paraburkholderia sp. LEh10]|uniref:peroxidase family protein n=1 Tax=Paraburkholderia sp. LEh10 TaxID=2821353 RepID=UPI001AE53E7A|nr:peroxidase family protein [Paraburkholderia sp. LEh10]MBP0590227.1 peroxidase family protein [Paraburkholderia sp. LEh10]